MCRNLSIFIECFCTKRIVESYYKKRCQCLIINLKNLQTGVCYLCINKMNENIKKIFNIINYFENESSIELYYLHDVFCCVERLYFQAK